MKKLLFIAAAVLAVACGKDDEKNEPKAVMFNSDMSLTEVNTINYSDVFIALNSRANLSPIQVAPMVVTVNAADGIETLKLELSTDNQMIAGMLGEFSAAGGIDLANPTEAQAELLNDMLHWPNGLNVEGKASVTVSMAAIFGLVSNIPGGVNRFDIKFTATSTKDVTATTTLKVKFVDDLVQIVGRDFDMAEELTFNATEAADAEVVVDIASPTGIKNMFITIDTEGAAFAGVLAQAGLAERFDLCNLTAGQQAVLGGAGVVNGDAVKGKTELAFDVSGFVPMMAAFLAMGDFTTEFTVTIVDDRGYTATETLTIAMVADAE